MNEKGGTNQKERKTKKGIYLKKRVSVAERAIEKRVLNKRHEQEWRNYLHLEETGKP